MSGDVAPYVGLITSEHAGKPRFEATVALSAQPFADGVAALAALPALYDVDAAIGVQLDAVGEWVGRTRYLTVPLTGVYFSFDDAALGFDQGTWQGPFDPTGGLVALPDDAYRTLLRAVIESNNWNGTVPDAYEAYAKLFQGTDFDVLIQDNCDMTMIMALTGPPPDAVTRALMDTGELKLKPCGVGLTIMTQSVADTPYFGFDVENPSISGFDVGAWGTVEVTL